MNEDLKTFREWTRDGRSIIKGQRAEQFVINDEATAGRGLFRRDQTQPAANADVNETENWTRIIDAGEWELRKAEIKDANRRPSVKVRPKDGGGVEVWCGPNETIIGWLKESGYRFNPKSHYWGHPNKDPEQIAQAFADFTIDGRRIRVNEPERAPEPAPVI